MVIHRRTLLEGAGIALSTPLVGCLGDETDPPGNEGGANDDTNQEDNNAESDNEGSEDSSPNEISPQRLSLASVEDDPGPLSFEIGVIDDRLTEAAFPTLNIAVKNTGDESVSWEYGGSSWDLPFPQGVESTPRGLVIGLNGNIET